MYQCSPRSGQPTAQPSPGPWTLSPVHPEPIEAQDFEAQAQPDKEITIFLLGILLRTRDSHLRKGMFVFCSSFEICKTILCIKSAKYYLFGIVLTLIIQNLPSPGPSRAHGVQ